MSISYEVLQEMKKVKEELKKADGDLIMELHNNLCEQMPYKQMPFKCKIYKMDELNEQLKNLTPKEIEDKTDELDIKHKYFTYDYFAEEFVSSDCPVDVMLLSDMYDLIKYIEINGIKL